MMNVSALMTRDPVCVPPDMPVYEAMKLLVENQVTGLPVVDDQQGLVGVITEKDMLRLLYEQDVRDSAVRDFMTSEVVAFSTSDSVVDVCECLIQNNFRRVPIVENGKLAGIVSRGDVIRYILKIRQVEK